LSCRVYHGCCAPHAAQPAGRRIAQELLVALDDLSGGLGAAAAAALAAHAPLRQVALPDGSVAERLPLRVLRGDDARVRAAAAAWDTPFGWLRAPVARLMLVGGPGQADLPDRVQAAIRVAVDAADSARTPWALLHVVCAPDRDEEGELTEALRRRFPSERIARLVLAPSGAPAAGAAALDARLGDCIRAALSWRCDAFRAELVRLEGDANPPSNSPGKSAPLRAEYAAGVAEGLAALLEAAAWTAPALEACGALASKLGARGSLLCGSLPLGGDAPGDEAPQFLVGAAAGAPAAAPTGRLTRLALRQRVFARTARLLRAAGRLDELGRLGNAFVRGMAVELAAAPSAPPERSYAGAVGSSRAPLVLRGLPDAWAAAACLQLAAVLQTAQADALASAGGAATEEAGVSSARARALSCVLGETLTMSVTHLRRMASAQRTNAPGPADAAPTPAEVEAAKHCAAVPFDDALPLVQQAGTSREACDALWLRLSAAAAHALRTGGRLRSAGALDAAVGAFLLQRGAVHSSCDVLLPRCRTLAADGWHEMLAHNLYALVSAAATSDEPGVQAAALLLLSLPPGTCDPAAQRAALTTALGLPPCSPPRTSPLDLSGMLALTWPLGASALRVPPTAEDAVSFELDLWSAAPAVLELSGLALQLELLQSNGTASSSTTVDCVRLETLSVAPGCNRCRFSLSKQDLAPGEYAAARLLATLGSNSIVVQPRRWAPRCARDCEAARWSPLTFPGLTTPPLTAPAAGGPAPRAFAALVCADEPVPLSVLPLLPQGVVALGIKAPQWFGVRVRTGRAPLQSAALALSGGPGLEVPGEQVALLRVLRCGAHVWEQAQMKDCTVPLPTTPAESSIVVWVRVHAGQTQLRAADDLAGTAGSSPASGGTTLRLGVVVRHSGHAGVAHMFATSLSAPAAAPFAVLALSKHMAGSSGSPADSRAALHVRIVSQLRTATMLRSVVLRSSPGGNAVCGSERCCCSQLHTLAPLIALPMPLPPGGEAAALFLLTPCARATVGCLEVEYESCNTGLDGMAAEAPTSLEEADGGMHALPAAEPVALPDVAKTHTCTVVVRLPDVPVVRVVALAPQLGRVGESLRLTWRVGRLGQERLCADAGTRRLHTNAPVAPDGASDAAPTHDSAPSNDAHWAAKDAHGEAPAYEADDERDDYAGGATPSTSSSTMQQLSALRWELRAPLTRWLMLSAREGVLRLTCDAEVLLTADCVPVAAGELAAPTLALRWHASGAAVRGVWEEPPAAAFVHVLPGCA
jgi:hypothetical protein